MKDKIYFGFKKFYGFNRPNLSLRLSQQWTRPGRVTSQSSGLVKKLNKLRIYFIKINIFSLSKQAMINIRVKEKLGPKG